MVFKYFYFLHITSSQVESLHRAALPFLCIQRVSTSFKLSRKTKIAYLLSVDSVGNLVDRKDECRKMSNLVREFFRQTFVIIRFPISRDCLCVILK